MKDWLPWVCVVVTVILVWLFVGDEDENHPTDDRLPRVGEWEDDEEGEDDAEVH